MADGPAKPWWRRLPEDILGIRFAVNVAVATVIVWYTLQYVADTNPIWAIASMVASSEPQITQARRMFRARLINVCVGAAVGLGHCYLELSDAVGALEAFRRALRMNPDMEGIRAQIQYLERSLEGHQ